VFAPPLAIGPSAIATTAITSKSKITSTIAGVCLSIAGAAKV
jgi:hypothetical protein